MAGPHNIGEHPDRIVVTNKHVNAILRRMGHEMSQPLRERFTRALDLCFDWYQQATSHNDHAAERERLTFIQEVRKSIKSLTSLLKDRRFGGFWFLTPLSDLPERLDKLDSQLQRVEELRPDTIPRTGDESDFVAFLIHEDHFKERSPFEWLAGVYLPEVYYLFFDPRIPFGTGRKFLSFAEICLRVMKIKTPQGKYYSKEAISRARQLSGKTGRRKGGPRLDADVPDQMEWYRHMAIIQALRLGIRLKSSIELARLELLKLSQDQPG